MRTQRCRRSGTGAQSAPYKTLRQRLNSPTNAPSQEFIIDWQLPRATLDRTHGHDRLHVIFAATVAEGEIQDLTRTMRMEIELRARFIVVPILTNIACRLRRVAR